MQHTKHVGLYNDRPTNIQNKLLGFGDICIDKFTVFIVCRIMNKTNYICTILGTVGEFMYLIFKSVKQKGRRLL